MKSKAPLVMMEQMVMILVFALAAALCLQAFVLSDSLSREGERRDMAVVLCQNTAEGLKASSGLGGTPDSAFTVYYDESGSQAQQPSAYRVEVEQTGAGEGLEDYLRRAVIRAVDEQSGKELFRMECAWQSRGLKE